MRRTVSIPDWAMLSWSSQVVQYPAHGTPGIGYFAGHTPLGTVDCLLYRNEEGRVVGILNHYPVDMPPHETAGNVNVFVSPHHRRQGIGTALVREAMRRWTVNFDQQRFSAAGLALAESIESEGTPTHD